MISQVCFDLFIGGRDFPNIHVDVKQTVGSSFDDSPLEVSRPIDYTGPMDYEALSRAVEFYYRDWIG
jgi:hypothetical protein